MKLLIITVAVFSVATTLVSLDRFEAKRSSTNELSSIPVCGVSNGGEVNLSKDGRYITALPGWGNHSYKVATESDSSQYFFDQGLSLYYGYHAKEALASFKESARFDPDNAMAYWGQALAMGPPYNGAHNYSKPQTIKEVLELMNRKVIKSPGNEVRLVGAMNQRYSEDPDDKDRDVLNRAYADAMKELIGMDDEAKILYVDAAMLTHPWDFWSPNGTEKPWTLELIALANEVLQHNPKHPAALHYHIHLTEASRHPETALQNAHILRELMPGVPHMVHMASHVYERSSLYADGVAVNTLADSNLRVYSQLASHLNLNTYSSHYFAVQTYCAFTGGMYDDALRYAYRTRRSTSPSPTNHYDQYLYMLPVLTKVRMGKWDDILSDDTKIPENWVYAQLLSDFATGMASTYKGERDNAASKLASLRQRLKDPALLKRRIPFNSPKDAAAIAEKILEGTLLYSQKQPKKGLACLEEAVLLEDKLIHTEPKDWPLPARQFLGAYLLREGKKDRARQVYNEDLAKNPANGWSLTGLYQSIPDDRKGSEKAELEGRIRKAFSHASQLPSTSVYME
jgi:hypothetical protein